MLRAFLRNKDKYPDPNSFRPERWLEPKWPTYQEPLTQYPTIKGMTSFGWGQRQCLGQTLTQDELIVACGALAWAFNLKGKTDPATGKTIPVPLDKSNSLLIIKPDPFQMAFEPRSEARRAEALNIWAAEEKKDRQMRKAFVSGMREKCPSLNGQKVERIEEEVNANGNGVPDVDLKRSLSLDKLEQMKRDLLVHINTLKSVPEVRGQEVIAV